MISLAIILPSCEILNLFLAPAVGFTANGPESFGQGVASKKSEFRARPVRSIQN